MFEQTLVVEGVGTRKQSPVLLTNTSPPDGFQPISEVLDAEYSARSPGWLKRHKMTGSQIAGLAHEKKGHKFFQSSFGPEGEYIKSPWIWFHVDGVKKQRWCQPDGLLLREDLHLITIIEFKLKHTTDAWWQLRKLYEPVIEKIYPGWDIRVLEVVKHPDPDQVMPELSRRIKKFDDCRFNFNWAILKDLTVRVDWRDFF